MQWSREMAEKSKILIIGGTGYIGKHIVEASVKAGHHTFALVRESTMGVNLVHGDLYDNESLVKAMKQVDVVISALSHTHAADQVKIIAAIKETEIFPFRIWERRGSCPCR